jgi:replication fork clamp-binding protein CrfC
MPIQLAKDNSFKQVLGNNQLFVEFLKDFIPIGILKDVSPEDIEDVNVRYIPKFEYEVVSLREYSPEDLTRFNDMLSLVLLIDRFGTTEEGDLLEALPLDYFKQIGLKIPENLTKLLSDVVTTLLNRAGVDKGEIAEITDRIEKKEIKTMFDALVKKMRKLKKEGYNEAKAEDRERIRQDRERIRQVEEKNRRLEEEVRLLRERLAYQGGSGS